MDIPSEPKFSESVEGKTLRLLLADDREITLEGAHVEGDSLIGTFGSKAATENAPTPSAAFEPRRGSRTAVAISDIRIMEVRSIDAAKTVTAIGVPLVLFGLVILTIQEMQPEEPLGSN
jgi:hypothetical protein